MSKIEWTGKTWNPIRARNRETGKVGWHCEKVSPACANCYAETMNVQGGNNPGRFGTGIRYAVDQTSKIEFFLDEKTLMAPLHWKKPTSIFPCSMTDLYGSWVPDEWLDQIYAVIAITEQHTYQILTKRPERRREYMKDSAPLRNGRVCHQFGELMRRSKMGSAIWTGWPLPNVWEGISVGNQEEADKMIPILLDTPAAVRWVSYEPALAGVDFTSYLTASCDMGHAHSAKWRGTSCVTCDGIISGGLDWLVVGGESGPGARPFNVQWARDVIAQCKASGVPCFVKQFGSAPHCDKARISHRGDPLPSTDGFWRFLNDRKGGDMSEWPEDLRVREYPA